MKKNVLIYPCSADNAIEIYNSIKYSLHFNVFGANASKDIADLLFDNQVIQLSNISKSSFIDDLNSIIDTYKIDFIFPTHDDVVYYFSQNIDKINCEVIGADPYINTICREKIKTYHLFKDHSFCPKVYLKRNEILDFPVFVKPNIGHGSIGAQKIENSEEFIKLNREDLVVTEFLEGDEYTVDCLTDKNNKLQYAFARKRHKIVYGVSKINIEANPDIQNLVSKIAQTINNTLKFKGLWFFQVKADANGKLKLLEICPRMATTMAFSRYKGVNLPLLTLFIYLNWEVQVFETHKNVELYRYSITKPYYNFTYKSVYIDFDDTLIVNQKVCLSAISFIYQCINNQIPVYLITKHEYNIYDTLAKFKIDPSIFKEILVLESTDKKSNLIKDKYPIFIDNFFNERDEVFNTLQIPVFDVEGISNLIKN